MRAVLTFLPVKNFLEIKETFNISLNSSTFFLLYLTCSKVENDNRNRYRAIKEEIKNQGRAAGQLTPRAIPDPHTPITLNPKKGKLLVKLYSAEKIKMSHYTIY